MNDRSLTGPKLRGVEQSNIMRSVSSPPKVIEWCISSRSSSGKQSRMGL
jgi:hypothetical protein